MFVPLTYDITLTTHDAIRCYGPVCYKSKPGKTYYRNYKHNLKTVTAVTLHEIFEVSIKRAKEGIVKILIDDLYTENALIKAINKEG